MEAKWVLTEDRKPTENGYYLVWFYGRAEPMSFHNGKWNAYDDEAPHAIDDSHVKAWFQVPEFKEEEIEDGR